MWYHDLAEGGGKIWKYPLVWGLLLLFFLFNLWNIYISVGTYSRREWRKMHEISRDGQWDPSVVEYAQDMYGDLDIVAMMRTKCCPQARPKERSGNL